MENKKLPLEVTAEEMKAIEAQAQELAKKHGVPKVYPYVAVAEGTNERIIGYLKEPNYVQKLFALGKMTTVDPVMAAEEMREQLTLREESDERTYSTAPACDKYRIGMAMTCLPIIEVAANESKKK